MAATSFVHLNSTFNNRNLSEWDILEIPCTLYIVIEGFLSSLLLRRATNDSFYPVNSFQAHRNLRVPANKPMSRPLSSADEAGPVAKRLRSTSTQPPPPPPPPEAAATTTTTAITTKLKSSKSGVDDPSMKKARARPALSFANIFSSSSRPSQPTTSSRIHAVSGKNNAPPPVAAHIVTRRSSRLQSGAVHKPHPSKVNSIPFFFSFWYFRC